MTKRFFLLAALAGVWSVSAQNGTLHLRLVDRVTREPVVGAVAELRSQADTARTPFYAASDIDGAALLQRVPAGAWRLRVTSLGYEALERELRTSGGKTDLGTLEMSPGAEAIESVVLEVPALRSSIRGDTLSYRASAYKVTLGTGVGSGFVSDRKLVTSGDEVPADGWVYCLPFGGGIVDEAFSTRGIIRRYEELTGETLTGARDVAARYDADPAARRLFDVYGEELAQFAGPVLTRFNADVLVLGGNISRAYPLFGPALERRFAADGIRVAVRTSALLDHAAMIGAASLFL